MLSNNVSHKQKVEQKKMAKLMRKAQEWEEWHGTWLENNLNQFFDKYSVKAIKSEVLRYILEDDADKDDVVHLIFYEVVKDFLKAESKSSGVSTWTGTIPSPATIDTMFELDIPIVGEMYETFCEHYGI